jgi:hypothetical protein
MSPRNCFRILLAAGVIAIFSTMPAGARPDAGRLSGLRMVLADAWSCLPSLGLVGSPISLNVRKRSASIDPGGVPAPPPLEDDGATSQPAEPEESGG